jgi:hypothetical protein
MAPTFTEPTEAELVLLAQRWEAVQALAREELDVEIDDSVQTIDVLQRIIDRDLVSHDGLLAVGTALGRVMLKTIPGLEWWSVSDEFGQELCLRYEETTLRVNPITMVAKRVARNEPVNLLELYENINAEVVRVAKLVD